MGLFDNIKKKNEAKNLGLSIEQYDEFNAVKEKGLTVEQYKNYLQNFSNISADDYVVYLSLTKKGFTESEAMRYVKDLSFTISADDYSTFLKAEKVGLSIEKYREYETAEGLGLSLEEYKKYIADGEGMSLPDYIKSKKLSENGFSSDEIKRYFNELSDKVTPEEYRDFIEAEKSGLDITGYKVYSSTLKSKMSAVEYAEFLKAQKTGCTLGKYLKYLSSFKDKMSFEDYDIYLRSEELGVDKEHYLEYLQNYKDKYTLERYIEFNKARASGISLEEYDLESGAKNAGMSIEEYKDHLEAEKLGVSDEEYGIIKNIRASEYIVNGLFSIPPEYADIPPEIFKHFEFTGVTFPKEANSISDRAFIGCSSLTEINIPKNIKKIGEEAFKDCLSLVSIRLDDGIEEICDSAFENCKSLTKIVIPGSVKSIGYHAFFGCENLKEIKILDGAEFLDVSEWYTLNNLSSVITPTSLFSISHLPPYRKKDPRFFSINEESAMRFSQERKIEYINPSNYGAIGLDADKDKIEYLEVHGDYLFLDLKDFSNLKVVNFMAKGSVKKIDNCPSLQMILYYDYHPELPTSSVSSKTFTLEGCNAPSLRFISIGKGPEYVKLYSSSIRKLSWVHIPESVKSIDFDDSLIDAVSLDKANNRSDIYENSADCSDDNKAVMVESVEESNVATQPVPGSKIPACKPGEEPDNIKRKLKTLFENLDSEYPDKRVEQLAKNHKHWAESVTEIYKSLGYPSGNAFLEAYGYTVVQLTHGRKSTVNPEESVAELKRRYPAGTTMSFGEIQEANPDIPFKSLSNKSNEFFGMTFAKYLIQEGVLIVDSRSILYYGSTAREQIDTIVDRLKERYSEKQVPCKMMDLIQDNKDIPLNMLNSLTKKEFNKSASDYLIENGLLISQAGLSDDERVESIEKALIERYKGKSDLPANISQVKRDNSDLHLAGIETAVERVKGIKFKDYLISIGVLKAEESPEDKLSGIMSVLKERYSSGEQKAYNLTDVIEQNLDIPVSSIKTLAKKVYGKSASDFLAGEGIISEPEWMTRMRLEHEAREAKERETRERIEAELAAPVETIYYDPPIYNVEVKDISGEEADEWEWKDTYWNREGELILDDYIGNRNHIIIPRSINGRPVMGFGPAFLSNCKAEIVEVPGCFETIYGSNGYGNNYLKTLIIGEGVKSIGESFMSAAKALSDLRVSKSVENVIGMFAFDSTEWFKQQDDLVIVGSVLTKVKKDHAVINIPYGVRVIGTGHVIAAFLSNIRKVVIPESVTTIRENAFCGRGNDDIEEFIIPKSLVNIGNKAFGINKWTKKFTNEPNNT